MGEAEKLERLTPTPSSHNTNIYILSVTKNELRYEITETEREREDDNIKYTSYSSMATGGGDD